MFQHVIVRTPCQSLIEGITSANLGLPDLALAMSQHEQYIAALRQCGVELTILPPLDAYPDSVFVEDAALCTPHCVVVTRPGADSRRGEAALMEPVASRFYERVERIEAPGTLEGGDVMMVGRHYYIGLSGRTNAAGAEQLIAILQRYGLSGSTVPLTEFLHLKTGCSYLEDNVLLATGEFLSRPEFAAFDIIAVPPEQAYAANAIRVNDKVIMPAGFPVIRAEIERRGMTVLEVPMSEFEKLDGGVSCLSLRF